MRFAEAERRLKALEARAGLSDTVYGVHLVDVDQVVILATGEQLPPAAFRALHPAGVIVSALEAELWEAL